ncbi:metal ABC transporter ATP-binding protein [Pseudoclavibacter sp. AY1F1]|uniref:metal ABC transporter ATP-binding protein n=1 Tax=Pseudoclavibacter sp. AY1F1 TaxID=2080583 RepID=UPI0015E2DAE3|nr:ATP-binding cassette domain-containing protein [Pseudoclavibacter sp. AY1F1]
MAVLTTLSDATVRYDSHAALAGVSLEIQRAAITVVVGHNGSGKSTLLGVLAGTTALTTGSLEWQDFDASPGRIASVPQHARLPEGFPITLEAAVAMGRWANRRGVPRVFARRGGPTPGAGRSERVRRPDSEHVREALEQLGLSPLRRRLLGELSGGQRQRTLVAQGIAQDTELLLLDEPTAGVDAESSARIAVCLETLAARGKTIVVASHDAHEIASADVVVALRNGRMAPGDR